MRGPSVLCGLVIATSLAAGCGDGGTRPPRRDSGIVLTGDDANIRPGTDGGGSGAIDAYVISFDGGANCTSTGGDADGDGFSGADDCNDCSAQINPGAFDFPGNGVDEDCNGGDAVDSPCDTSLGIGSSNAEDAARAMGLCTFTTEESRSWGVISARYTQASGSGFPDSELQYGVLPSLGAAGAIAGSNLVALSSGLARAPGQASYMNNSCSCFGQPVDPRCDPFFEDCDPCSPRALTPHAPATGFSSRSSSCPGVRGGDPFNSVALELRIRVPTNAQSFVFRSSFYTTEYPAYICSEYNDYFVVLRQNGGTWENIVFDTMQNPVSVNSGFLAVCSPGTYGGRQFTCPMGTGLLANTGFSDDSLCQGDRLSNDPSLPRGGHIGGSTGWLRTQASVEPGGILVLRFAIWDSADGNLDSTAIIDGWEWELDEVSETPTTEPEIPS